MPYPCPYCSTVATYSNNLKTHLMGKTNNGGHEKTEAEASAIIQSLDSSRNTQRASRSQFSEEPEITFNFTTSDDAKQARLVSSGPALTKGHEETLKRLEDDAGFRETRRRYEKLMGKNGVYFRPTDKGIAVISLDYQHCTAMIGVGDRSTGDEYLATLRQ